MIALLLIVALGLSSPALKLNTTETKDDSIKEKYEKNLKNIEIWGVDGPIGEYLWNHILEGKKVFSTGDTRVGSKVINNLNLTYITGPKSEFFKRHPTNVVFVLDASNESKKTETDQFLDQIKSQLNFNKTFAVIKSETNCRSNSFQINKSFDVTFLIHSNYESDTVFTWPSGVQT